MRTDEWLLKRLEQIWELLFSEHPKKNEVRVRFKGRWKNKFGHIKKLKDGSTEIVVNGIFKSYTVPEYIIDVTLAHEIIHYIHGFNSPYPQKFKYPHQGGVVRHELLKRGFGKNIELEKKWIKDVWPKLYSSFC